MIRHRWKSGAGDVYQREQITLLAVLIFVLDIAISRGMFSAILIMTTEKMCNRCQYIMSVPNTTWKL